MASDQPLRILHAVRAPVGGIFRHILDLAQGQAERGHSVGIVADSTTGGERADAAFKQIAPRLQLGVTRMPIRRSLHPADAPSWLRFRTLIRRLKPDVIHGHGAQAGAFVRMSPKPPGAIRVYTPHGGSLHFAPNTLKGMLVTRIERALMNPNRELALFLTKSLDFSWETTMAVLFLVAPNYKIRASEVDALKDAYLRLDVATAQEILQNQRARKNSRTTKR